MEDLEIMLSKLNEAGKTQKIKIYNQIFQNCYNNRNIGIYELFDDFLNIFRSFLEFDGNPEYEIKESFTSSFLYVVKFARNMNNVKLLDNCYNLKEEFKEILVNDTLKAEMFQAFGYLFSLIDENDKSIHYLSKSLELINKTDNIDILPGRFTNLGYIYESMGNFDKAEKIYYKGLDFAKKCNNETSLKLTYAAIGRLHSARNNYHKALLYYNESLKLFKATNLPFDKIAVYLNIASVYTRLNEPETALEYFKKIDLEFVSKNNQDMYYSILLNKGVNLLALKKYNESEKLFIRVLEFAETNNMKNFLVGTHINLGNLYRDIDRQSDSKMNYEKALDYLKNQHEGRQEQVVYQNLAAFYKKNKNYDKAIECFKKAEILAQNQKNEKQKFTILEDLSTCYQKKKMYRESLEMLQKSLTLKEKYQIKQKKKEEELENNPLLQTGHSYSYLFKNTTSFISKELTYKIGSPILGVSEKINKAVQQALLASKNNDVSVILRGESGTGKELFAQLIHYASERGNYPFVDVNSASFTSSLAESTLFGHVRGAFTGASHEQRGLFENAHKGTLFLDEIAEMPLEIQVKFLRVLEAKTVNPVGSNKSIDIDFRLISATHQNLEKLIKKDLFRFDLFNRINTINIRIPSLRERREDIPILLDYYSNLIAEKLGQKKPKFTSSALSKLYNYSFPGNVRELINILERVILFSNEKTIDSYDIIVTSERNTDNIVRDVNLNLADNEVYLIKQALIQSNGIKTDAAKLLGISPYALKRRIDKYEI